MGKIRWILVEDGKVLHRSGDFNKLLNFTAHTHDAVIYFREIDSANLVWAQNPYQLRKGN